METDVIFKGCTRPPMFLGVPYVVFILVVGAWFLFAIYVNIWLLLLIPVWIWVLRVLTRRDDMIFRLLGLRWQFAWKMRNRHLRSGDWVLTPNAYDDAFTRHHF